MLFLLHSLLVLETLVAGGKAAGFSASYFVPWWLFYSLCFSYQNFKVFFSSFNSTLKDSWCAVSSWLMHLTRKPDRRCSRRLRQEIFNFNSFKKFIFKISLSLRLGTLFFVWMLFYGHLFMYMYLRQEIMLYCQCQICKKQFF